MNVVKSARDHSPSMNDTSIYNHHEFLPFAIHVLRPTCIRDTRVYDVQSLFVRTYRVLENDDNLFGSVDSGSEFQYGYRLSRFRAHIALDITDTEL